jgi:hypothetical protein
MGRDDNENDSHLQTLAHFFHKNFAPADHDDRIGRLEIML